MAGIDINKRLRILGQLIANPGKTWKELTRKPFTKREVWFAFFYPAVTAFGLAEFFGMLLSAYVTGSFAYIFIFSVLMMGGLIAAYHLSVFAIRFLLNSFGVTDKKQRADQLLALPLLLGYVPIAVTALFRSMFFLVVLSLYAFYLFWLGTQKMPGLTQEQKPVFGILSIVFTAGIHLLIFLLILALRTPLMTWL